MERREDDGVGEHLFQQGALYLLERSGMWVSRREIQEHLEIGKSTACRLITALSLRLPLQEKAGADRSVLVMLPTERASSIRNQMIMIPTLTDGDRRLLTLLLLMADSSHLYGTMVRKLRSHLVAAGGGSGRFTPVYSASSLRQHLSPLVQKALPLLFLAINEKKAIILTYQSPLTEKAKSYEIYPIGIFEQDGNLYLHSYNPKHEDTQVNACSRIHKVEVLPKRGKVPGECRKSRSLIDPFGIATDKEELRLTVRVERNQAFFEREKEWGKSVKIAEKEDGSIVMDITTRNRGACRRWVLSLGSQAVVLSPVSFREEIEGEIEKTLRGYGREKKEG